MTVKEYLSQGYRLEQRIKITGDEIEELRRLSTSVSPVQLSERVQTSRNTNAPFVRVIDRIVELETRQAAMLENLLAFKQEMLEVIDRVKETDERLVLHYRYVCNKTWVEIGELLNWDERTIRRLHGRALLKVELPKNPTVINRGGIQDGLL